MYVRLYIYMCVKAHALAHTYIYIYTYVFFCIGKNRSESSTFKVEDLAKRAISLDALLQLGYGYYEDHVSSCFLLINAYIYMYLNEYI